MHRLICACLAAASVLAFGAVTYAQLTIPPTTPEQSACPPGSDNVTRTPNENTGSGTLSDKLSNSKGVICPPAGIDPGLTVPPPGGGRMPVIPPPGSPGGDPSLQPK